MKEFCFGIIPLRCSASGWEVLLIKHNKGHWGFPKGHPFNQESPEQVACRELYEETGLSVTKFLQVNPIYEKYTIHEKNKLIEKTVTYFLAEVAGEIQLLKKEIEDFKWLSFNEALKLITFNEAREVGLEAKKLIDLFLINIQ